MIIRNKARLDGYVVANELVKNNSTVTGLTSAEALTKLNTDVTGLTTQVSTLSSSWIRRKKADFAVDYYLVNGTGDTPTSVATNETAIAAGVAGTLYWDGSAWQAGDASTRVIVVQGSVNGNVAADTVGISIYKYDSDWAVETVDEGVVLFVDNATTQTTDNTSKYANHDACYLDDGTPNWEARTAVTSDHNSLTGIDGDGTYHLSETELDTLVFTHNSLVNNADSLHKHAEDHIEATAFTDIVNSGIDVKTKIEKLRTITAAEMASAQHVLIVDNSSDLLTDDQYTYIYHSVSDYNNDFSTNPSSFTVVDVKTDVSASIPMNIHPNTFIVGNGHSIVVNMPTDSNNPVIIINAIFTGINAISSGSSAIQAQGCSFNSVSSIGNASSLSIYTLGCNIVGACDFSDCSILAVINSIVNGAGATLKIGSSSFYNSKIDEVTFDLSKGGINVENCHLGAVFSGEITTTPTVSIHNSAIYVAGSSIDAGVTSGTYNLSIYNSYLSVSSTNSFGKVNLARLWGVICLQNWDIRTVVTAVSYEIRGFSIDIKDTNYINATYDSNAAIRKLDEVIAGIDNSISNNRKSASIALTGTRDLNEVEYDISGLNDGSFGAEAIISISLSSSDYMVVKAEMGGYITSGATDVGNNVSMTIIREGASTNLSAPTIQMDHLLQLLHLKLQFPQIILIQ